MNENIRAGQHPAMQEAQNAANIPAPNRMIRISMMSARDTLDNLEVRMSNLLGRISGQSNTGPCATGQQADPPLSELADEIRCTIDRIEQTMNVVENFV